MNFKRAALAGLFVLAATLSVQSCGHTNNLKEYSLREQHMTFRSRWTGKFSAEANFHSPVHGAMGEVAAALGSMAASDAAGEKLEKAAKPELLAMSVSSGIEDVLRTYLKVVPVHDSVTDSKAIVETEIREFTLHSQQSGIYATVRANMRMLHREDGKVIWEDGESVSVPLHAGVRGALDPTGISGIVNAAELANLSEEEIQKALTFAAEDAGHELGETLREDIAELP
jgi:hypothetical protein